MTINIVSKADVSFLEAPASWFTRYITPQGFTCQITVRGENGKDLLEKADIALAYLLQQGYKPEENHRGSRNNGNGSSGRSCALHECELKRFEKDGKVWFSHKAPDGSWCRGQ